MQSVEQRRILQNIAQGRNTSVRGVEHRAAEAAGLRNVDLLDRGRGELAPDAEALEDQAAGIGQDDGAKRRRRILSVEGDAQTRLVQTKRSHTTDRARASYKNVNRAHGHRASALRRRRRSSAPRRSALRSRPA